MTIEPVSLAACVCVAITSPGPFTEALLPDGDAKRLQGTWVLLAVERWGVKQDQDAELGPVDRMHDYNRRIAEERAFPFDPHQERTTLTVKGTVTKTCQAGQHVAAGTFTLDETREPKVITLKVTGWRTHCCGDRACITSSQSGTFHAIYSLDGDTLRWCLSESGSAKDLPTRFATANDEKLFLFTFKRDRSPAPEKPRGRVEW